MKGLFLIFLLILALYSTSTFAATDGYCKVMNTAGQTGYWKLDSKNICDLFSSVLGLQTEWKGLDTFTLTQIEETPDFCDGWNGECTLQIDSRIIRELAGSGSRNNRDRASCVEEWECGDWSACVNDEQTRDCYDVNYCGTVENMPEDVRGCGVDVLNSQNNVPSNTNNGESDVKTVLDSLGKTLAIGLTVLGILLIVALAIFFFYR